MKCPKCGYLGFDSGERCRNCGYDFSLVSDAESRRGRTTPPATPGGAAIRDPGLARGARYRRSPSTPGGEGADRALNALPEGMRRRVKVMRTVSCAGASIANA